jgi:uncharacterized membrane protein YccC
VVALVPLAILAAFKTEYRTAPTTAIILLLTPSSIAGPLASATQRMMGIGLGSVVALIVSLVILPARAHGTFAEAAGRAVSKMSELAAMLLNGSSEPDPERIRGLHGELRNAISQAEAVANEVLRERAAYLGSAPDPLPMCRALRRIRNDLTMIGRTTAEPLPDSIRNSLLEITTATGSAIATFLAESSEAIKLQQRAPSLEQSEKEIARFASMMRGLRRTGSLRELSDDTVGTIYGLAFSIEQLHQNLKELVDRTNDLAHGIK